ncbi:MAG: 16S rRNA (guanine(966)-N(2))-methyltransferase RsmD [Campylobacterales bacterium]
MRLIDLQTLSIIAGKYKGKKLELPPLEITRSTKSIVRGSLFDRFQLEIKDAVFVEVFGGSGSMGFEALSRGASKAVFCEKNPISFETLKQNAKSIDSNASYLFKGDSFELIDDIVSKAMSFEKNIIYYLDPPFDIREGMDDIYLKTIELIPKLSSNKTISVSIEHHSKQKLPDSIDTMKLVKTKKFGKTTLSYYEVAQFI